MMEEPRGESSTEAIEGHLIKSAELLFNKEHWISVGKIPSEISTEIIANLPVKSLIRFKSVCKEWRDTISEPRFIATQFSRAIKSNSQSSFIFLPRPNEHDRIRNPISSYYLVEQNLQHPRLFQARNVEFKLRLLKDKGRILSISCVDGFLCVSCLDFYYERVYTHIYNPATGEKAELPDITVPSGVRPGLLLPTTLCSAYSSGKHKVVSYFDWGWARPVAHVFTLGGSNSWRKLENVPHVRLWRNSTAFVHGSLHWLARNYVLTFDLSSEEFGSIPYPQSISLVNCEKVLNLGGCLSIVHCLGDHSVELWVMMDYNVGDSWKKIVIKKALDCLPKRVDNVVPMTYKKQNGEILLLFDTNIVSYDINSEEYKLHKVLHKKGELQAKSKVPYDVYPYIGNLATVKGLMEN